MPTRYAGQIISLSALLASTACVAPTWPSEADINNAITQADEEATRSVAGRWWGTAANGTIRLEFSLGQAADGSVQGAGTMRDTTADTTVPITVSGKYERPSLSLTFTGMRYEERAVEASFAGTYTPLTGTMGSLRLTADGNTRSLRATLFKGAMPPASLAGRVTDAMTDSPVTGATVSARETSVTTSTTGHYSFNPMLTAGRHQVTVSHPQYVTLVRDVEFAPYAVVDFELQPK